MRYVPGQPPRKRRRPWAPGQTPKTQNDPFVYAGGEIAVRELPPPAVPIAPPQPSSPLALQARQAEGFQSAETVTLQACADEDLQDSGTKPLHAGPQGNSMDNPANRTQYPPAELASPAYIEPAQPGDTGEEDEDAMEAVIEAAMTARQAARERERAAKQAELVASRPVPGKENQAALVPIPPLRGDGPHASLASFSISVARTASSAVLPPDLARHSRLCSICSHPDRDAIEADFLHWHSPKAIAQDYRLPSGQAIYRHARATGLLQRRKNEVSRVMERYLERIDSYSTAEFDKVTRAIRVYSHLDDDGRWFEPPRTHYVLSGRLEDLSPAPSDMERAALPPQPGRPRLRSSKSGRGPRKGLPKPG
jgi:hypothetical protein